MKPCDFLKVSNPRGFALLGVIALMVLVGLFSAVGASLVASSLGAQTHQMDSLRALALAEAGKEWFLEELRGDTDWSDQTAKTRSFGGGSFEIAVLSASVDNLRFRATGVQPSGFTGQDIRRQLTLEARRGMSPFFNFSFFQGQDSGDLTIQSSQLTGDLWSRGTIIGSSDSFFNGVIYVPTGEEAQGAGVSMKVKIAGPPYPELPIFDPAEHRTKMNGFDALLNANSSIISKSISSGTYTVSGVQNFSSFRTTGAVTITGSGTIVVRSDVLLNTALTGPLRVSPSPGGKITIIAGGTISVGNSANPPAGFNGLFHEISGVTLYSAARNSSTNRIYIAGPATKLSDSELYSRRYIRFQDTGSARNFVFVDEKADGINNAMELVLTRSDIAPQSFNGNVLISLARGARAFMAAGQSASLTLNLSNSLVYANGTSSRCYLQDVRGDFTPVLCSSFSIVRRVLLNNQRGFYQFYSSPLRPFAGFQKYVWTLEPERQGY